MQVYILVLFLPPYSPDMNPIEHTFSKVNNYLRRHDELVQIVDDVTPLVRAAFDTVTEEDSWMDTTLQLPSVNNYYV